MMEKFYSLINLATDRKYQLGAGISVQMAHIIRLPSPKEARSMGIKWEVKRVNRINLMDIEHVITYGTPRFLGLKVGLGKTG